MPLNGDRLGNAIVEVLKRLNEEIGDENEERLRRFWRAIADEIVKEIKANGIADIPPHPHGGAVQGRIL